MEAMIFKSDCCSNKMLLKVLFPSEDTVRTYLNQDHHANSDNGIDCAISTNTATLNGERLYSNAGFGSKRSQPDYINAYDMASASMYSEDLDNVMYNLVFNNNFSLAAFDLDDYGSLETSYDQFYNDFQSLQNSLRFTYNDYIKLRGNTLLLARLGYKFTITLNTDNDKVPEIWDPNVAQKILSVEYSPLSLKKDFLKAQVALDQFESLLITEAVNAFQENKSIKWPDFSLKIPTNPSLAKFVSICRKLENFKKLCNHDQILLLSTAFYEVDSMNCVFNYNQTTDDWICPEYGVRFGRCDLFIWNRLLYDATIPAVETLPDKWRKDEVVITLVSLIIIFNPDLVGLESPDSIRHEQYVYIHLLKRYLESICESPCDASDNLYRLLVGVEKFRGMGEVVCELIDGFETGYHRSLRNWISNIIKNEGE